MRALWIDLQRSLLLALERLADRLRPQPPTAPHLIVGHAGEREALFELRRRGYIIVAQRWKTPKFRGDLDLIAWHQDWLCFIEVKTRSERDTIAPPETAVDRDKQKVLRRLARVYIRSFPKERQNEIAVRFDIISVYLLKAGPQFELFQGAFGW